MQTVAQRDAHSPGLQRSRGSSQATAQSGERKIKLQNSEPDLQTALKDLAQHARDSPRTGSRPSSRPSSASRSHALPKALERQDRRRQDEDGSSPPKGIRKRRSSGHLDMNLEKGKSGGVVDFARMTTSDVDDLASTSTSTASGSSPQAASLLLKAMQRRRRSPLDIDESGARSVEGGTPRTPTRAGSGGQRTPSCGRSRGASPAGELRSPVERSGPCLVPKNRNADFLAGLESRAETLGMPLSPSSSQAPGEGKESGLLARRRKKTQINPLPLRVDKKQAENKETVRIKHLDAGQKIYDLYFWDEVIQEEGCGGKVVVCSPKAPGDPEPGSPGVRSLLSPKLYPGSEKPCDSNTAGAEEKREPGSHVMKIKAKMELRKCCAEEQFRKAHLKMLNLPPHMGILPLWEVWEDDNFYYVVMEKANGGSLLCSLLEEFSDGIMPERAVKRLLKEILSAVQHIHSQGMLHRDIKIDNLVVQVSDEPSSPGGKIRNVKIIDFDIADPEWIPNSPGICGPQWVGTVRNSAPETFRGSFSQKSDLYSVGTVLFLLMAGRNPYDDEVFASAEQFDELEILIDILYEASIDWDLRCWDKHPICRDFCQSLLAFDPEDRPSSAEEALRHQWFTNRPAPAPH